MCAAGGIAPSLIIAGTSSETITMYDGVVGMPMPRTIPAIAVSTSAAASEFCDSVMTTWVKVIPSPVIVTQPITMPAQAQAIATASVLRAPSTRASTHVVPADALAGGRPHEGDGNAGQRAGQRAERRRIAEDQPEQHDEHRHEQMPPHRHHREEARQLRSRHARPGR